MSRSSTPGAYSRGQSPLDGRRAATASPQTELSSLAATVPPLGSSFSDLRATVAAQQRQMESLIDRVGSLMSAVHGEGIDDTRKLRRPCAGPPFLPKDREPEGSLRGWLQAQMRESREHLDTRLHDMQYRLANEVHSLRARLAHLEELIDDDEVAEVRRDLEMRVTSHSADVQNQLGAMAAELSQQLEARGGGPISEEIVASVEARLQQEGGALTKLRDQLRQEAESRLEAKMATTFGLSQRLMTELRQELQGQVLQVHENTQHLAMDLSRGLEAQEKHMHRTLQRLLCEGGLDAARSAAGGKSMQEDDLLALEEHLAGCRDAAADCARCASKASQVTEALEDRFQELSQELLGEVQNMSAQEAGEFGSRKAMQQLVRDEVHRAVERSEKDLQDGEMKENSDLGRITVVLEGCKAAVTQCQRHAAEASAMAAEAETSSMTAERHLASCETAVEDIRRYTEEATDQIDRRLESR